MIRVKKANQLTHARSCASGPPGRDAEPFDQRFRGLNIAKLRLNFDEMPVVFVGRIGRQRRFSRLQLLM